MGVGSREAKPGTRDGVAAWQPRQLGGEAAGNGNAWKRRNTGSRSVVRKLETAQIGPSDRRAHRVRRTNSIDRDLVLACQALENGTHVVRHHPDQMRFRADRNQAVGHRRDALLPSLIRIPDVDLRKLVLRVGEIDGIVGELLRNRMTSGRTTGEHLGVGPHLFGEGGHPVQERVGGGAFPWSVVTGERIGLIGKAFGDHGESLLYLIEGVGSILERLGTGHRAGAGVVGPVGDTGGHAIDGCLDLLPVPVVVVGFGSRRATGVAEDRAVVTLTKSVAIVFLFRHSLCALLVGPRLPIFAGSVQHAASPHSIREPARAVGHRSWRVVTDGYRIKWLNFQMCYGFSALPPAAPAPAAPLPPLSLIMALKSAVADSMAS